MNRPVFARFYARVSPAMDRGGVLVRRRQLLAGLAGRVVEVGAGNGLNFRHYPDGVTEVLAVEPEPLLRGLAVRAAEHAAVPVRVVDGTAERLPAADGSADAVVASLMLCSVPDPDVALREMRRVLRPGGELRFLEHVRAETAFARGVQRAADATVWPRLLGGCHTGRDTVAAVREAGFEIRATERFRLPEGRVPTPSAPHVLGHAVRAD